LVCARGVFIKRMSAPHRVSRAWIADEGSAGRNLARSCSDRATIESAASEPERRGRGAEIAPDRSRSSHHHDDLVKPAVVGQGYPCAIWDLAVERNAADTVLDGAWVGDDDVIGCRTVAVSDLELAP
jgi:hypothetical protein